MSHATYLVVALLGEDGVPRLWQEREKPGAASRAEIESCLLDTPATFYGTVGGSVHLNLGRETPSLVSPLTDHLVDFSTEWLWGSATDYPVLAPGELGAWSYARKADATGHHVSAFTRSAADRRPDLRKALTDHHSADVRADVAIYEVHSAVASAMGLTLDLALALKAHVGESVPAVKRQVAAAIAAVNTAKSTLGQLQDRHFEPAARVMLAEALIEGHGPGGIVIPATEYYRLAGRLAERLAADPVDRAVRLANALANLRADHDRTELERLVPRTHRAALYGLDVDRLYGVIILAPPQYGSAPEPSGEG